MGLNSILAFVFVTGSLLAARAQAEDFVCGTKGDLRSGYLEVGHDSKNGTYRIALDPGAREREGSALRAFRQHFNLPGQYAYLTVTLPETSCRTAPNGVMSCEWAGGDSGQASVMAFSRDTARPALRVLSESARVRLEIDEIRWRGFTSAGAKAPSERRRLETTLYLALDSDRDDATGYSHFRVDCP